MKSVSPRGEPAPAFQLARTLEERLGIPAARYMTPRESTPRRAPPKPVAPLDRHPGRRFRRSIGSGEVGGAIITALVSGLLATGLGWLAADLF